MALKRQFNALKKSRFPRVYEVTIYANPKPFISFQRAFSDWMKDRKSPKPQYLKRCRPRFKKKSKVLDSFYVGGDQVKVDGLRFGQSAKFWLGSHGGNHQVRQSHQQLDDQPKG